MPIKYCPGGRYSLCNNVLRYRIASTPLLIKTKTLYSSIYKQNPSLWKHAKGAGEDKTRMLMSSCIVLVIYLCHLMTCEYDN